MAKQLNVDLNFRANTTQAQQQIQQLQTSLTQIAAAGTVGIGGEKITTEIKQASAAAKELQMHLSKAMNTQTGTLDLNRLNNSLTGAKTNLQTLSSSLLQIGPAGTTAFTQLATAVSQADRPILALNGKLTQLWTVIKNTINWQLSSSMIHGFIGGVSQAYRYAQDLNESLNNIRIVTGYSAERMEEFAIQANRAAKALSTTTNEYTKASLIYFQQGLNDQQVKDRTDVTIKMANVSRQSAEVVSDQMTAVWNNFYDGSKSLEHYADVMVKLGAETASSSDEIAGGLEKFAAIGETVGLSFEYAASALATITAETRQSEEVVGTSLKTIFARIQGLNMGETLEDGTDFNKYSETLAAIGVNIKDQNGQLKDMDNILDELGAKWGTLARDQQMAVAQNVAGLRQYNQFISLMSNWDVMQKNLERSNNASGALDKQAEIYAESWEAARNRVTASAEAIYDALLNDKFFIDLNNMFSGLLDSVNGFIDEIGGLKTIMIGAFGLLASYLGNKIQPMINNLRANFQVLFTGASQQAINLGNSMRQAISSAQANTGINVGIAEGQQLQNANDLIIAKNKLSSVNKHLSSEERFLAETELQLIQMEQERAASLALTKEKSIEKTNQLKEELMAEESLLQLQQSSTSNIDKRYQGFQRDFSNAVLDGDDAAMMAASAQLDMIEQHYTGVKEAASTTANTIRNEFIASLEQANYTIPTTSELFRAQINEFTALQGAMLLPGSDMNIEQAKMGIEMYAQTLPKVVMEQKEVQESYRLMMAVADNPESLAEGLEMFIESLENAKISAKDLEKIMRQFGQGGIADKIKTSFKEQKKVTDDLSASQERLKQAFANFQPAHNFTGVERMTAMASALSSVAMAAMSVKTIFSSWANEDMSFGEKLTSSLMGLGMLWPSLTGMITSFGKALGFANIQQAMQVTKTLEQATASQILTAQLTAEQLAQKTGISLDQAEVIMSRVQAQAMMEEAAKRGVLGGARMKEILAEKLGITAKQASTIMSEMKAGASWKEALATAGVTGGLNLNTKAIWANVKATWAWLWPILAVVAAIGLIVAAVKLSINAYNADANAAKEAATAAEEAAKAFEEAQTAYENFKSSMEGYKDAVDGLKELTKGTIEYKEQIIKANEEALKLIKSQNLLYGKDYDYDEDGLIKFKGGVLETAKEKEYEQMKSAQAYKEFTSSRARSTQTKADLTEFNRKELGSGVDWAAAGGKMAGFTAGGAALGATLGTVVPIIGNAIGAVGGAIVGAIVGLGAGIYTAVETWGTSTDNEEKAMLKLADEYARVGDAALTEENIRAALKDIVPTDVIDRIVGVNTDTLKQQLAAIASDTAAIKGTVIANASSANRNNKAYQNLGGSDESKKADWQNLADKIISDRVANTSIEEKDKIRQANEALFDGSDKDAYEKYLKARFGEDAENYRVTNQAGENATLQKKNEEGTWENIGEKNTLSNDEVLDFLTQHDLIQFNEQDKKILDNIIKVEDTIAKNVGIADKDVLTEISNGLAEGKSLDLSLMDPQEIEKLKTFLSEGGAELGNKLGQDYVDALNQAINNYDPQSFKVRMEQESKAILEQGAEELEMTSEALEAYTQDLMKNNEELKDNKKLAAQAAVESAKFGNNLDKLEKSLNDNIETINKEKDAVEKSLDYYEALGEIQKNFEEAFGVEVDSEFITENLDKIQKAAKGDIAAIDELRMALMDDIIANIILENGLDETATTNVMNAYNNLRANMPDLEVGASLNSGPFIDALNELILAASMTTPQVNEMLSGMGMSATFASEPQKITKREPDETTTHVRKVSLGKSTGNNGEQVEEYDIITTTETKPGKEVQGTVDAYALETSEPGTKVVPKINSITKNPPPIKTNRVSNPSGGGGKGGGGGGGGGSNKPSKPKTVEPTEQKKKSDEVERYHEINQELEDLQNSLDEIGKLKDEAWGADKLAAMDKEKKKLQEITASHKKYQDEIAKNLNDDRWEAESKYGAIIDPSSGRITNYEELQEKWMNEWNAESQRLDALEQDYEKKIAAASDEGKETLEEEKEKNVTEVRKQLDKEYEEKRKAIEQYEETLNLSEEAQRQLDDYLRQIRQLNYEQLEYKIEFRVEINKNDIADIEHELERLGDNNVYASAERIALIEKNAVSYRNIADVQIESMREAERLYQEFLNTNGKSGISQENYMERLQESKDALQEAEISIREGIEQIGDELENTFDLVDEKLDQQFTKFDRLIELMEHYKNVVSLTEGEASYKEFNKILKASQEVIRDRIEADKSEVAMWENRRKQLEADITTLPEDSPAKREAEEALQAIMEKEADAKSQLMADIEQLGEYAREIFENSIEQAMKDFEDEIFGRPLNSIIESIEMMNSRQEELLTTTNKIYETNKLIRNVEKDIEATTNNRAKQAFVEFQNKVKQKQEQNELTKFELDLLNAEYEITKAQIALEEAQDAKDMVRLTRDAEGNYGYVYTANEDKVSDAEQALEDATNNYYNTALEGAQKYQDQIYQHIQEWEEKTAEVIRDTELNEEEKNRRIKEINDTYNTLITQNKQLYYMAVGAMQESAYNTQVDYDLKGIESAENWFTECDSFLSDLEDAQDEYDRNTEEISEHTEENFGKMSTAIRNTKQESEYLKDQIVDELVPELDTTLKDSIDNATKAWWEYIKALQEVIRLTDEAMKKNHDTQLKEGYKDDYAAEISKRLANGAKYSDYDIQQLLQYRWEKMGGIDNTDYQALINAGGTSEQIALWEVLRRFKIEQTDWATSDKSYASQMRENKLDQDYSQLIIDYFKSSSYARWTDSQVQKYLNERQIKINERGLGNKAMSNAEFKEYIAKQLGKEPKELKTGGYTGSWGPEGKLAVLHEKELVLNAQDTENFLSATNILREISQMLDRDALIASLGAINLRAMTLNSPADQVLQQEVTIHADFPNVTDHNEIEIAIDNLINAASQHAYRE